MSGVAQRLERSRGELRLEFKRRGPQSTLAGLYQDGCLKARLPRRYGPVPEAVCINTSGGIADGDSLQTTVACQAGACAIVSGQAAERVYRSREGAGQISATLSLEDGAKLAWLPQETILFDGGRLVRTIDARLRGSASLLAVESTILGRTAMGESVYAGSLSERWRIEIDDRLAYIDAFALDDTDIARQIRRPAILNGCIAFATAIYVGRDAAAVLDCLRQLDEAANCVRGASRMDSIVVTRFASTSGQALRAAVQAVVSTVTESYDGMYVPKVWTL